MTKLYVKTNKSTAMKNGFVKNYFLHGFDIENASNVIIYIMLLKRNRALFSKESKTKELSLSTKF
jgi:hypothetical protein